MKLFDKIKKAPCKSELVTIDGDQFQVTGKTLNDTGAMMANARKKNGRLDGDLLDRLLLEACVSDPATGETMSADEWGCVPRTITGPLMKVCLDLCGLDDEDIQRDPKDTGSTES